MNLNKFQGKCILSICDISSTRLGSFEEFLILLTEELNKRKLKHIIVFRDSPNKIIEAALIEKGAVIKVFKPSELSIYNFFHIYQIIREAKPSIVHFHFYPIYSLLNYLGYFSKTSIIYTDHMGYKKANSFLKKKIRRSYYYINSKLYGRGIEKIVCVSNFVMSKYLKEYRISPKKICVIYNGININRFKKNIYSEELENSYQIKGLPVVTIVGLRKAKGPHYLMKVAPSIINDFPNVMFIFVGEGECKKYLEEVAAKQKIENHVIFTGNLEDIVPIYHLSSCVVIPSEWDEAFCFVAVEAMATETNIISFDSGAIREVVFDKLQIIPKDCSSLSNGIKRVLKENNEIELGLIRNHVIENFSLDTCIEKYISLYEQFLIK